MHKPLKYYDFFIIFFLAIMAGGFLSWALNKKKNTLLRAGAVAAALFSLAWIFFFNLPTNAQVFVHRKPDTTKESFHQIKGLDLPRYDPRTFHSNYYFNLLRNIGTIDWKANIPFGEHATPKFIVDAHDKLIPNPDYRGEAYFREPLNKAQLIFLSPNRIMVQAEVAVPDILIVNQNFHNNWQSQGFRVLSAEGLLGVVIERKGTHTIVFEYHSGGFLIGAVLTILTLVSVGCWLGVRPRMRNANSDARSK